MRAVTCFVAALWCSTAWAQAPADAFNQAEAKFGAGDRAGACTLYEQALTGEAQLPWKSAFLATTKLALCKREANKLASAAALYRRAAEILRTQDSAENRQRQQAAQRAADELGALVSRLTIAVPSDLVKLQGLRITIDNRDVPAAQWNKSIEIDGGEYTLRATAVGRADFNERVTIDTQKDSKTVIVTLQPGVAAPPSSAQPPPETPQRTGQIIRRDRTPALIAGGAGVVALGIAMGFELSARSTYSKYEKDPAHPPSLLDAANNKRDVANVALVGGVVAFAAGAALWFLWPAQIVDADTQVGVAPMIGADLAGASATIKW